MLRLVIALAVIVAIFIHSPERRPESLSSDLAALKERTQTSLMEAAAKSPLAQSVAESALRRTLSEAASPIPAHRDERAANVGPHP